MYKNLTFEGYSLLSLIGYFLYFILGLNTISISYDFYNNYRILEVWILLIINIIFHFRYACNYQLIAITATFGLFFLGSLFWAEPLFIITDILVVYLIINAFIALKFNNQLSKFWVLASLLLFLLLPIGIYDYIKTGNYYANWYPLSWNIRVYNSYFLITAILAVWFYLTQSKYKNLYLLYLFLGFLAVLLDGGRSVTLSYSIFIALIVIFYSRARLALIGTYISSWAAYLFITYLANMEKESSLRIARESSSGRLDLWQNAMSCWADHPIIGCGFYQLDKYSHLSAHPHNLFIQALSETGIIGFGFLIVIIYQILKHISWNIRKNAFVIAGLLAVTIDMSLSGIHVYAVTQMALLWLFVFLLKNPEFEHSKYFNKEQILANRIQKLSMIAVYFVIEACFLYLSISALNFSDELPVTPPRFWVYGYKLY